MTQPSREEMLAQSEAVTAPFKRGLPVAREVTTTGEPAAVLAALPADIPLVLAGQVVARPDLDDGADAVETIVAHLSEHAEPAAPDNHEGPHPVMPALGLTTVRATRHQDAGAELEHRPGSRTTGWPAPKYG